MTATLIVVLLIVALVVVGLIASRARRPPRRSRQVPTARPDPEALPITPTGLGERIRALFDKSADSEETWRGLEEALVRADVGPAASSRVVARVRESYTRGADPAALVAGAAARAFDEEAGWRRGAGSPGAGMVVGVDGAGITTASAERAAVR